MLEVPFSYGFFSNNAMQACQPICLQPICLSGFTAKQVPHLLDSCLHDSQMPRVCGNIQR